MPNNQPDDADLLTPLESVARVAQYAGSHYQARALLADALHSGELIAVANRVLQINDIDPTDPWEILVKNAFVLGEDVELEPQSWRASYCWPDEVRYWRWKEGNLLLNTSDSPLDFFGGVALEGVRFDRRTVLNLIGRTDRTGVGGRKLDKKSWSHFWVNFLYDCAGDLFDWTRFENRNQLRQAMLAANPYPAFSDGNVGPEIVDIAWDGLVARSARERHSEG